VSLCTSLAILPMIRPERKEGINEWTIYIDPRNVAAGRLDLKDCEGRIIAEYFFRILKESGV